VQLEDIFASSPLPMLIHDHDKHHLLAVNASAVAFYGYSMAEMLAMTLADLTVSITSEGTVHRRGDGSPIDVQLAEHHIEYRGQDATLIVVQDNSHRKTAIKFQMMIESATEGICIVNQDGNIEQINRQLQTLFGYKGDELIGKPVSTLIPPEQRAEHAQHMKRYLKKPHSRSMGSGMDLMGFHREGRQFPIEISLSPIHLHGRLFVMTMITDISERKRLESRLIESELARIELERAQEMLAVRERFVAMVSHEFRTPLSTINTAAQILQRYIQRLDHTQIYTQLDRIAHQTKRMRNMLDDLLVISRVSAGEKQLTLASILLDHFCYAIWEELEDKNEHKLVCINTQELASIRADEQLMRHILTNLLSNAVKYSPPGSTVTVTVYQDADEYIIKINDQGMGIPQENLVYIFEPFFRADNTRTIVGTGLGLTIVKNSVDLHMGRITVESQEGDGTTFTIYLPGDPSQLRAGV